MWTFLRSALTEHLGIKLVSLVFAIVLFLVVRADKDAVAAGYVEVEYQYDASKWILMSTPPRQLRVSIRGPWSKVNRFDERKLKAVKLNVESLKKEVFAFQPDMIQVPAGLRVVAISPPTAEIRVERLVERKVPLVPRMVGEVAAGYALAGRPVAEPSTVLLRGPSSLLAQLATDGLPLAPVDLTNAEGPVERTVDVASALPKHVSALTALRIKVLQAVVATQGERALPDVALLAVGFAVPDQQPLLDLSAVALFLKGPVPILARIDPKTISVAIDLTKEGKRLPGVMGVIKPLVPADVKGLPPGVTVTTLRPDRVLVRFVKKDAPVDVPR
jgi:hypothetical protein